MSEMKFMEQRFFNPSLKLSWASLRPRVAALSRALLKDDSGQSMTEYILILFMVVLLFNQLKGRFLSKMQGLVDKVGGDLDSATSSE
jgi:Flp pilus assembly pilin Flp